MLKDGVLDVPLPHFPHSGRLPYRCHLGLLHVSTPLMVFGIMEPAFQPAMTCVSWAGEISLKLNPPRLGENPKDDKYIIFCWYHRSWFLDVSCIPSFICQHHFVYCPFWAEHFLKTPHLIFINLQLFVLRCWNLEWIIRVGISGLEKMDLSSNQPSTLWWTNIAMENHHFLWEIPL